MQPSESQDPVEHITLRVRGLEISISVRPARGVDSASSTGGFEIVAPSAASGDLSEHPAPSRYGVNLSIRGEEQLLNTTAASELGQLLPGPLEPLCAQLRADHSVWTPRARIARAFRAGLFSHRRLRGVVCEFESPIVPFKNTLYVVLRSLDHPDGFLDHQLQHLHLRSESGCPCWFSISPRFS